jgi:hypothetical protein
MRKSPPSRTALKRPALIPQFRAEVFRAHLRDRRGAGTLQIFVLHHLEAAVLEIRDDLFPHDRLVG